MESYILRITEAWGVSDADKLEAVRLLGQGADPHKVVTAIEEIANAQGFLQALRMDVAASLL
jgi:hypothetical protein